MRNLTLLNEHANYDLLTNAELHKAYDLLSRDLSNTIKGGGSMAWKRKTVADHRDRINAVLAIILTRQEAIEDFAKNADTLLNA